VSHSKIRFPLLIGAMLAAALPAYSQQSSAPPANTSAAAASAATAPAQTSTPSAAQTTASDSESAKPSDATVKKAKSMGLHAEVHNGATQYCWEDANLGTRFPTKKCVGEDQLNTLVAQRQATQDNMRRNLTNAGAK
jgi:hypothetical protein